LALKYLNGRQNNKNDVIRQKNVITINNEKAKFKKHYKVFTNILITKPVKTVTKKYKIIKLLISW
jgi:hypothetical protein